MRISEQWLREFVDPPASTRDLAERLTSAGIEVTAISEGLPALDHVLVGEVRNVEPHPQADRLRVCTVFVGKGKSLQIVCGAANVNTGMRVAVILPGGHLPDGSEIHTTQLRGVKSQGMLCSARELGLGDDDAGLLALPAEAKVGHLLIRELGGADKVLEIEITPNRGDCLSALGVARELAALYGQKLRLPDCSPVKPGIKDRLTARIEALAACPVFAGRIIRGLRADAVTPMWLRERLRRAGLRSLHPVVDVTQYVMLELGQPLHAYDLKRLSGGIQVRMARSGESLKLLDGNKHTLEPDILVIADHKHVLGVAGIMGGSDSSVQPGTADIYLEAAFFSPDAISGRQRKLGLQTEAAYRFERGVDPTGQTRALERATRLLQEIAGGQAGPITKVAATPRVRARLRLRQAKLVQSLGMLIPGKAVSGILAGLGFMPSRHGHNWQVSAPAHRFDIEREEDLVEEVGRIFGYDKIPAIPYPAGQRMLPLPEERLPVSRLRDTLVARGYQEVITYSFVDAQLQVRLTGSPGIALANPISAEMNAMRQSLWPGLIQTLRYNLNRQQQRVRIFECGMRFIQQHTEIKQENVIAGLIFGLQDPLQWGLPQRNNDFADLRGDVEALLGAGGHTKRVDAVADTHQALHPSQAAKLMLGGMNIGWLGALHPAVARELDLNGPVFMFELSLEPLRQKRITEAAPITAFPALSRDLALVVEETIPAGRILDLTREAGHPLVSEVRIFDIYRGKGIDSGRKSVALSLILQDSSRTLTDEAADATMRKVVQRLQDELGATIRD
ncbi:MAG: phenylalanine--tRNA ligase subunit beta [Gammaproteobacteria bacterium]|nr:phenylalanine--tRNA ligase subunit beta [Gammaproteobacteria bacterium]